MAARVERPREPYLFRSTVRQSHRLVLHSRHQDRCQHDPELRRRVGSGLGRQLFPRRKHRPPAKHESVSRRHRRGRPGLGKGTNDHDSARGITDAARLALPAHRGRLRGLALLPSPRPPRRSSRRGVAAGVQGALLRCPPTNGEPIFLSRITREMKTHIVGLVADT